MYDDRVLAVHMDDVRDRLVRIEGLLTDMAHGLSDTKERVAEAEGWRKAHEKVHDGHEKRIQWLIGLVATTLMATVGMSLAFILR